jgi:hypothetical protein
MPLAPVLSLVAGYLLVSASSLELFDHFLNDHQRPLDLFFGNN